MKTILEYIQKKHITNLIHNFDDIKAGDYFKMCGKNKTNNYCICYCKKIIADCLYCELVLLKEENKFSINSCQMLRNHDGFTFTSVNKDEIEIFDTCYDALKNNEKFKYSLDKMIPRKLGEYTDKNGVIIYQ